MKLKYWLSSKRKLDDLRTQLQEARDSKDMAHAISVDLAVSNNHLREQLRRVSRERFQERELRLAAEERRDVYLAELANEEE